MSPAGGGVVQSCKVLQKEKIELTKGLLARLEELKKAKEDVSLCEAIGEETIGIDSLWLQLDQKVMEKFELHGRV